MGGTRINEDGEVLQVAQVSRLKIASGDLGKCCGRQTLLSFVRRDDFKENMLLLLLLLELNFHPSTCIDASRQRIQLCMKNSVRRHIIAKCTSSTRGNRVLSVMKIYCKLARPLAW
jgi:hypothetical protein